jgi:hypothetical protein
MRLKPKFKPSVTRVKLNPEQAVLSCNCYNTGLGSYDYAGTSKTGYYQTDGSTYCLFKGNTVRWVADSGVSSCAHSYTATGVS